MEQTKYGISVKRRIYSFPMKGESRAEAICRSFKQYTLVDWTKYNKVSMRIVTSVKYPLLMGELVQLMSVSQSLWTQQRWILYRRHWAQVKNNYC
nr:hypothetical protein [Prevotella sp.]